ncbi:uncharacterized protein G2W53_022419 [Senna tora]|uniref:Uncharacterized protein n=1 Tax=Senna tora TaxID=362788 RepID=A0A834TPP1_9FABA|nr:uncharacterized protein G2W53_022419 [Senna tora]
MPSRIDGGEVSVLSNEAGGTRVDDPSISCRRSWRAQGACGCDRSNIDSKWYLDTPRAGLLKRRGIHFAPRWTWGAFPEREVLARLRGSKPHCPYPITLEELLYRLRLAATDWAFFIHCYFSSIKARALHSLSPLSVSVSTLRCPSHSPLSVSTLRLRLHSSLSLALSTLRLHLHSSLTLTLCVALESFVAFDITGMRDLRFLLLILLCS